MIKKPKTDKNGKVNIIKRILAVTAIIIIVFLYPCSAVKAEAATQSSGNSASEETTGSSGSNASDEIIRQQADDMNLDKINEQLRKYYGEDAEKIIPQFNPSQILTDAMQGKPLFDTGNIFKNIINYLLQELFSNMDVAIKLIIIAVIVAILQNIQTSFLKEGVSEIAYYACYVVMVTLLIAGFKAAATLGSETVDEMVGFMQISVPVLVTMLISGGNVVTGNLSSPLLLGMVELSASLLKYFFIPLIFFSTILSIIGNITDKINISGISSLIKKICMWALGIFMTVFVGAIVIQSAFGSVIDGTTGKAVKFAVTTFIPVVGKFLAEATDTVIGCALVIKNAAGIGIVIGIVIIAAAPLLKILALIFVYKVSAAIMQMIGGNKIAACVDEAAGSLTYIFGITAVTALMFFITISIMMGAGNSTAAIR